MRRGGARYRRLVWKKANTGSAHLAGLAIAAGLTGLLAGAGASAGLAGRATLDRVLAWHLAKGLAVEFGADSDRPVRRIDDLPLTCFKFIRTTIQAHPGTARFFGLFRVSVTKDARGASVEVEWRESGATRRETEYAPGDPS